MFLLKELPSSQSIQRFISRYPDADVEAISAFLNILRAGATISAALDALLAQHGLLQGRWWVLVLLMREEGFTSTPSDLADKVGVTRASMTGLIDGLEQDGLVVRTMDALDRRKLLIRITPAGEAKLDQVMPVYYRRVKALISVLPKRQLAGLQQSLKCLSEHTDLLK